MNKIRIAFPELDDDIIKQAVDIASDKISAIKAQDLKTACQLVAGGKADALIAGINYTSRDVILACRDEIGVIGETFSSCFVMERDNEKYVVADCATCKNPSAEQLYNIVLQTHATASVMFDEPKIAMLSFSTLGSGGHDQSIDKIKEVVKRVRAEHPDIIIDGEMQLDAAIDERVGAKKAPGSPVAGQANVLICPDLNSGNILYKSMELFGKMTAAGPILQGFKAPASDLSRGSTVDDVLAVIDVMIKLI